MVKKAGSKGQGLFASGESTLPGEPPEATGAERLPVKEILSI